MGTSRTQNRRSYPVKLKSDDIKSAASIARKYSAACESQLFRRMTTEQCHAEIKEADRIAELFEEVAEDTENNQ